MARPPVLRKGSQQVTLKWRDDLVAERSGSETVALTDSDLVFVGYGVVAPEHDWDDYKGLDVRGKTLVMLVNDPPVPDPSNPTELDPKMFGGRAMTYYGRWTYKFEIASEKGAAGVFIIHETGPAGYPFEVVQGSWTGEQFDLVAPDKNMSRVPIQGWVSLEQGTNLLKMGGQDFQTLKRRAASRDFEPVPLGVTASMTLKNKLRTINSQDMVARLESDPKLSGARRLQPLGSSWDRRPVNGDRIYNGAVDNAVGVAGISNARAFTALQRRRNAPCALAVTAEEQGLLGSATR